VQEEGWGQEKLIHKEHENTAWIWDLNDNELRFVGHLSYGIVHYLPTGEVVWSPDGKYVALPCNELSEAGATGQIYVINVETGESKRLTSFVGANTWPVWSPDSKKIMYVQVPPKYWWSPGMHNSDEGSDVWVVDIDGSNRKQLTDIQKNWEAGDWSPDGCKIAYLSWKNWGEENEIWLMNEDGSDIKLLAKAERVTGHRWSPDGSQLAFVTGKAIPVGLDRDIYVLDLH
jgi:Tol biopolymer transport system component